MAKRKPRPEKPTETRAESGESAPKKRRRRRRKKSSAKPAPTTASTKDRLKSSLEETAREEFEDLLGKAPSGYIPPGEVPFDDDDLLFDDEEETEEKKKPAKRRRRKRSSRKPAAKQPEKSSSEQPEKTERKPSKQAARRQPKKATQKRPEKAARKQPDKASRGRPEKATRRQPDKSSRKQPEKTEQKPPEKKAREKKSPEKKVREKKASEKKPRERTEKAAPKRQKRTPRKQPEKASQEQPETTARKRTAKVAQKPPATAEQKPPEKTSPEQSEKAASKRRKRTSRKRPEKAKQERPEKTAQKRPAKTEPKPPEKPAQQSPKKPAPEKPAPEPREVDKPEPAAATGFADLGLSDAMLKTLASIDYLEPTPIQAGLIPRALEGVDLMGQARTGTGKTAAFCLPILEQLHPHKRGSLPQALVLTPTRELAVQVRDECTRLASGHKAYVVAVYGGKPIRQQIEKLTRGAEVVVGTPGRVMDLMDRGALMLGDLRFAVLDEADRMLDIGFRPDIEKILRRCPQARQTLLLSATIPPPVKRLAQRYMRDPEMLDFSPENPAVETIEQFYFTVDPELKFDLLVKLLQREEPTQAIIFCRTRRGTDKVQRRLARKLKSVDTIHGDLPQSSRDRVMRGFRGGTTRILVATDVVGRGIDVTRISHIINYDIPQFCDDYVHRVGRAGRMGREGVAYTFVTPEEGNELTRIEIRINILLKRDEISGFAAREKPEPTETIDELTGEPIEEPKPKPVYGRRTRRHRRAL